MYNPLPFRLQGESLPARPFAKAVLPASAVQIMAGAPIPEVADTVLPAEYATSHEGLIEVTTPIAPGGNIGRCGMDIRQGTRLFQSGRRLRPQDVGLLAAMGFTEVRVIHQPRVRMIITGDELVKPGGPRDRYYFFEANSKLLRALIERDGGEVETQCNVADDPEAIRQALLAPDVDIVLVSGGSGIGSNDHAPTMLANEGELVIHGIALSPASSTGMGSLDKALVFLLPGSPTACLCAYDFFAGRALRLAGGRSADWPYAARQAVVARKIVSTVGRVDYCRIRIHNDKVEPITSGGALLLSSTTHADGFVIVPADSEGYPADAVVTVYLYGPIA
jgi:molybdopterin molybdotransferase